MNILLEFSRSNLSKNRKYLLAIKENILTNKHKLVNDLLEESESGDQDIPEKLFDKVSTAISDAQAIIIEASEVSLSLGYILTQSISLGKPVLFLRHSSSNLKKSRFADVIKSKFVKSLVYNDKNDLIENLENFLNENQHIKTRFNLVMPNQLDSYITQNSRSQKISKTEYIMNLIRNDMNPKKK